MARVNRLFMFMILAAIVAGQMHGTSTQSFGSGTDYDENLAKWFGDSLDEPGGLPTYL